MRSRRDDKVGAAAQPIVCCDEKHNKVVKMELIGRVFFLFVFLRFVIFSSGNKKQPKLMRKAICMNNSGGVAAAPSSIQGKKKGNKSDGWKAKHFFGGITGFEMVFAETCARPPASLAGCRLRLSVNTEANSGGNTGPVDKAWLHKH